MEINLNKRISALIRLGYFLQKVAKNNSLNLTPALKKHYDLINGLIETQHLSNPWFTINNSRRAFEGLAFMLEEKKIKNWISHYPTLVKENIKTVAIIMAGNIPAVGFHDFLCCLLSGNKALVKLSSQDEKLIPAIFSALCEIEKGFIDKAEFITGKIQGFDAVIATGSNNSSRYFEYYFGKYPNIIRKNRNGIAVLNGDESSEDLFNLGCDIFTYFGLGCRNVSKIFVPVGYRFDEFFNAIEPYHSLINHHKYLNNYEYNKAIYLVNKIKFFDNGFLMLVLNESFVSPISVIYFEEYDSISSVRQIIDLNLDKIQCIVSVDKGIELAIPPGKSQFPELWDYADGVDTLQFLCDI